LLLPRDGGARPGRLGRGGGGVGQQRCPGRGQGAVRDRGARRRAAAAPARRRDGPAHRRGVAAARRVDRRPPGRRRADRPAAGRRRTAPGHLRTGGHPAVTTPFARLLEPRAATRYLFFGGKGGVGKTTLATATATRMADLGFRTTIV